MQEVADRRKEGKTVRKRWFERMAKALFLQLYPDSPTKFMVSNGWFNRFLSRNEISIRIVTNKAQQTLTEYCAIIISEGSACAFSAELVGALSSSSAGAFSTGSAGAFSAGSAGELSASDAFSACAPSAGLVSDVHTSKGKLPVEPVSLARRSKRLEGVHRRYVVPELFPSTSDTGGGDGVEFCWRDEALAGGGDSGLRPHVEYKVISWCLC